MQKNGIKGKVSVGIDLGTSLSKIAMRNAEGELTFETLDGLAPQELLDHVLAFKPVCCGATGGGAARFLALSPDNFCKINEFSAWGAGGSFLAIRAGLKLPLSYVLVSVGTGTSILQVSRMSVTRLGGTALGGGTILGLGRVLAGDIDFAEICSLANEGRHELPDLMVSDIYRAGEIPLSSDITASAFGRIGLRKCEMPDKRDLLAGMMQLIGENICLITSELANKAHLDTVVLGGSALHNNPCLCNIFEDCFHMLGKECQIISGGEYAGAAGALLMAEQRARRRQLRS